MRRTVLYIHTNVNISLENGLHMQSVVLDNNEIDIHDMTMT